MMSGQDYLQIFDTSTIVFIVFMVLVVCGFFALAISSTIAWAKNQAKRDAKVADFNDVLNNDVRLQEAQVFEGEKGYYIAISKTGFLAIMTPDITKTLVIHIHDINDIKLVDDEHESKSISLTNTIAGKILFGNTGAIIATLGAPKIKTSYYLSLTFQLNNFDFPIIVVVFFSSASNSALDISEQYEKVQKILALLTFISKEHTMPKNALDQFSQELENKIINSKVENMVLELNYTVEDSLLNRVKCFEKKECPYCGSSLATKTGKRFKTGGYEKNCASCEKTSYLWYGSKTRKQYLLTKTEYDNVKNEDNKNNLIKFITEKLKYSDITVDEYEKLYLKRNNIKVTRSYLDILWELLNKKLIEHISNKNYGLYRSLKYTQFEILFQEKKYEQCLPILCEALYYDINGASNGGFNPEYCYIPPIFISYLNDCKKELNVNREKLMAEFINVASSINLPVKYDAAWKKLEEALDEYDGSNE